MRVAEYRRKLKDNNQWLARQDGRCFFNAEQLYNITDEGRITSEKFTTHHHKGQQRLNCVYRQQRTLVSRDQTDELTPQGFNKNILLKDGRLDEALWLCSKNLKDIPNKNGRLRETSKLQLNADEVIPAQEYNDADAGKSSDAICRSERIMKNSNMERIIYELPKNELMLSCDVDDTKCCRASDNSLESSNFELKGVIPYQYKSSRKKTSEFHELSRKFDQIMPPKVFENADDGKKNDAIIKSKKLLPYRSQSMKAIRGRGSERIMHEFTRNADERIPLKAFHDADDGKKNDAIVESKKLLPYRSQSMKAIRGRGSERIMHEFTRNADERIPLKAFHDADDGQKNDTSFESKKSASKSQQTAAERNCNARCLTTNIAEKHLLPAIESLTISTNSDAKALTVIRCTRAGLEIDARECKIPESQCVRITDELKGHHSMTRTQALDDGDNRVKSWVESQRRLCRKTEV